MKLVIVQTPAQAQRLSDVLGEGWQVEPCYGDLRQLPQADLGIDLETFEPAFELKRRSRNRARRLKQALAESKALYLATPPTVAGEVMAWHGLALLSEAEPKPIHRVHLTALTPAAVQAAFADPQPLDPNTVEAALTAQLADRLAVHEMNRAWSYPALLTLAHVAQRANTITEQAQRYRLRVEIELGGQQLSAWVHQSGKSRTTGSGAAECSGLGGTGWRADARTACTCVGSLFSAAGSGTDGRQRTGANAGAARHAVCSRLDHPSARRRTRRLGRGGTRLHSADIWDGLSR